MHRKFRTTMGVALCVLIALTTVTSRKVVSGQGDGGRLEGTWDVLLTPRNCNTGDPLPVPPIRELINFNSGGTMLDSTSGALPSGKTPGHGVWGHVAGNTYEYKFKFLNIAPDPNDPTKAVLVGWAIVSQELQLNSTATEYTSSGTVQFYNASGVPTGPIRCSTTAGTRFE